MEVISKDVVIVGAGVAGLATSLGLHRLGIESLVLESSPNLRVSGFALTTWTNAWKALEALGIAHSLRKQHSRLYGIVAISTITGQIGAEIPFEADGKKGEHEVRCVKRQLLLETLTQQLPNGTIKFCSKVVSIEKLGYFKLLHLIDGTIIKTKVLIGCDGVNSVVANWLELRKPIFTGRSAIRGYANMKGNHGYGSKFLQFFGNGFRSGLVPCDNTTVYWFFTWTPSATNKNEDDNPTKMKEFVLSKLEGVASDYMRNVVENTNLDDIICSPLRYRYPWEMLWGKISEGNVCVAGDAFHPMTPDIGQGGCAALEDGIVLARCLGEALLKPLNVESEKEEFKRIEIGLKKYTQERRWRSFQLITTAYLIGFIQQSKGRILNFLRDIIMVKFMAKLLLKMSDFDCGKLYVS